MNNLSDQYNPYGDGTTSHSPIIGESWAYHMGHFLLDQRFGVSASCQSEQRDANGVGIPFCPNTINHPPIDVLEQFNPNLASDPFRWIPKGLMEDLMDNTPNEFPVNDQVLGFSIQQLFNALQTDVTTVQQYRLRFIQQNPNNQTVFVTNLFDQYHY